MTASIVPRLLVLCLLVVSSTAIMGWKNPETVDDAHRLTLTNALEWHLLEPKALLVSYDPEKLSEKQTINLYGYTERNSSRISKKKVPFTKLATAKVPNPADGELDVLKLNLQCIGAKADCNKFDMGYVELFGEKTENVTYGVHFLSQIVPLGWFLQKNYASQSFKDWAYGKCNQWYKSETNELVDSLKRVSCPSSLEAAESDPGWYIKSYYMAGFPANQRMHGNSTAEPKQICFYSSVENIASSLYAAPASMCCYRRSDSELLHKEFMSIESSLSHGSSVLRSHPFGSDAHEDHFLSGQVPYLSHWYWDKLPYLYCCYWWQGNACAELYLKNRPVPKVRRKPSGSKATYIYGPHVHQFGGSSPLFCPTVGEYWLIKHPAIEIQIRSYVVSAYVGETPPDAFHKSQFYPASSKTAFFNGLAMRSMQSENQVVEMVSPEGEFRTYVQSTDLKSKTTILYDGNMGRGFGTNILLGEATFDQGKIVPLLVKNDKTRVGMYVYIPQPGEEFLNLYVSITGDLDGNFTGLLAGGSCSDNKILTKEERLFTAMCDNCDDFKKYRDGRPLYFVPISEGSLAKLPKADGTDCKDDATCKYMVWSTLYQPYYDSSVHAVETYIKPLLPKIATDASFDTCDKPDIQGLYIKPEQSFKEKAVLPLKCLEPLDQSSSDKTVTCEKSDGKLRFAVDPQDFICGEKTEVKEKEQKAASADAAYTSKNYKPPPPEENKDATAMRALRLQALLGCVALGHLLGRLGRLT